MTTSFFHADVLAGEHAKCRPGVRAGQGIAADQVASREVHDGQWIAVALVAEHELAFEVRV